MRPLSPLSGISIRAWALKGACCAGTARGCCGRRRFLSGSAHELPGRWRGGLRWSRGGSFTERQAFFEGQNCCAACRCRQTLLLRGATILYRAAAGIERMNTFHCCYVRGRGINLPYQSAATATAATLRRCCLPAARANSACLALLFCSFYGAAPAGQDVACLPPHRGVVRFAGRMLSSLLTLCLLGRLCLYAVAAWYGAGGCAATLRAPCRCTALSSRRCALRWLGNMGRACSFKRLPSRFGVVRPCCATCLLPACSTSSRLHWPVRPAFSGLHSAHSEYHHCLPAGLSACFRLRRTPGCGERCPSRQHLRRRCPSAFLPLRCCWRTARARKDRNGHARLDWDAQTSRGQPDGGVAGMRDDPGKEEEEGGRARGRKTEAGTWASRTQAVLLKRPLIRSRNWRFGIHHLAIRDADLGVAAVGYSTSGFAITAASVRTGESSFAALPHLALPAGVLHPAWMTPAALPANAALLVAFADGVWRLRQNAASAPPPTLYLLWNQANPSASPSGAWRGAADIY